MSSISDKQRITLVLDAHRVPLEVQRDKEPIYREAAELLNKRYQHHLKAKPQASAEQLWMYVALEIGVTFQSDARQMSLAPVEQKIKTLNTQIENIINPKEEIR